VPQLLKNVRVGDANAALAAHSVAQAIAAAEAQLGTAGRILVRKSGTEPLIRVMAEGDDSDLVRSVVDQIIEAIRGLQRDGGGMKGRVLIVAGSDSGGGAGIQADIKAVTAMGAFGATAITALTAQNTEGVHGVVAIEPAFIAQQIEVVLSDIGCRCAQDRHAAQRRRDRHRGVLPEEARARRAVGRRSGDDRQGWSSPVC